MTPREESELAQSIAAIKELFTVGCREMYLGFKTEGFSDSESLRLAEAWMVATIQYQKNN